MRTHLVFAAMTIALLALVISQSRRKELTYGTVTAIAKQLAAEPYQPRAPVRSKILRELNYDQTRDIRWKDEHTLWRKQGLPFQAKFFFAAGLHSLPVTIFQVNRDGAGPWRFSPQFFDFGSNVIPAQDRAAGDYSGFRIHFPLNKPDYLDETLVFLGASYFRALAKDQQWGLSGRGIAINTETREEFPSFTTFWLVQPPPTGRQLKIYALLDGPSLTGAYEFLLEPGMETRIAVRAALFFRRTVAALGIAPLTSMYWYGENTSDTFGNFRPEVHDSDGLLIHNGRDEWLWRPLSWSRHRQNNVFEDDNPKGFGLLQRDRDFSHYQDLEANYHTRPSLWVIPSGSWGKGSVRLVQWPTKDEFIDNIAAFWQPAEPARAGSRMDIAYTLLWYSNGNERPPLAQCLATRIEYKEAAYYRKFVIEFWGPDLANLPENAPIRADLASSPGGDLSDIQAQKNPIDNTWRVTFVVSRKDEKKIVDLRCGLKLDGKPVSETWSYTLMPP